jgi:serine/threonine protein kinase
MNLNTYTKRMNKKEYQITRLASNNNISPTIISTCEDGDFVRVEMIRYPSTINDLPKNEWQNYVPKVIELLQKLHSLGICHRDISEENIVIDIETGDVKLIDFGLSRFTTEIDLSKETSYSETPPIDINSLLELEINWTKKYLQF